MSKPIQQVSGFPRFEPPWWLRQSHAQTIAGNFWLRPAFPLQGEPLLVEVDEKSGSKVLCHCHWQQEPAEKLTLLLVHGLEGSSDSRYIQGITRVAWEADCNVVRMNMRNCGNTDVLSTTLYHSGLSGDVARVALAIDQLHGLKRIALVGYSMGGNLVLKLAGELGAGIAAYAPQSLVAAVGVSPAMDLATSADALHELANRPYELKFLRGLLDRFRRKCALYPDIYHPSSAKGVRNLRQFDDFITAPYSGFRDAEDYYQRAASAKVAGSIALPTLILHSRDDPFIRMLPETRAKIISNPAITFLELERGGHCAFLTTLNGRLQRRQWAESMLVHWLQQFRGV
jgi:hypothetical protein